MSSASEPEKREPPKKGRPERRVSMTPEEAEKVLDRLLEPEEEEPEKAKPHPKDGRQ